MKDPAFLFYPNDWLGGTMGMTLEEKGGYIELLTFQFNKGVFTEIQAKRVLNGAYDRVWPVLKDKFKEEGDFFFNERLENEKLRRKNFVTKQSDSGKKGGRPKKPNESQTEPNPFKNEKPNETNKETEAENETSTGFINSLEGAETFLIPEMQKKFKAHNPAYPPSKQKDFKPLLEIANFLSEQGGLRGSPEENRTEIVAAWEKVCITVSKDNFYSTKSLSTISNHIQELIQKTVNGTAIKTPGKNFNRKDVGAHVLLELVRAEHDAGRK